MNTPTDNASSDLDQLTLGQALGRALARRCPTCGQGYLFRNMIQMNSVCDHCGLQLERPGGYYLGSTYINYGVTALITTVSYVVLRYGAGIEKEILLPGLLAFCLIFPLVFFRFARSLWLSLDCYFDRVGASEAMSGTPVSGNPKEVANSGD